MEATKSTPHPTATEMMLPQIEQALALAGNARQQLLLTSNSDAVAGFGVQSQKGEKGMLGAEMMGLLPLALAWEGSALAMLTARGKLPQHALLTVYEGHAYG